MSVSYQQLEGSERRPAVGARRISQAAATEEVRVIIWLRRRPDGPPMPDFDYWAKTLIGQRKYLSRDEFGAKYGAAKEDFDKVIAFAKSHGLEVVETNTSRRTVIVSGKVSQINQAFAVDLGIYETPDEKYRGREGFINIPSNLDGIVLGVFGLDNRKLGGGNFGDPANTKPLKPNQVADLYNFPTNDAHGQTIGIVCVEGGYKQNDINHFFTTNGLTGPPTPKDVHIQGASNSPSSFGTDIEVVQDICLASAFAPKANIAVYFTQPTQSGWVEMMHHVIHPDSNEPNPSVLSCSFHFTTDELAGGSATKAAITAISAAFQEAANFGITIFTTSGDHGSNPSLSDDFVHVEYPATDPWATCCGGTTIGNVTTQGFEEVVWDDSKGTTGGGISSIFPLPSWQEGIGVPQSLNFTQNPIGRGIPDIAGNASGNSGYHITVDGQADTTGGTSAVAPLYAGLIARINAALNLRVGYLNPVLYALGGTNIFRDIYTPGETNGNPGYPSTPGWDACTGLGVIDGQALLSALQQTFQQDSFFIVDRSTYGQFEVQSLINPNPAVFHDALYVVVEGFTPDDFNITTQTLVDLSSPLITPTITIPISEMTATCVSVKGEDPSLPARPQRFTFTYDVAFSNTNDFPAPGDPTKTITIQSTITSALTNEPSTASAQIDLVAQPDPYFANGPVTWLSEDLRVFQLTPNGSLSGASSVKLKDTNDPANDAKTFLTSLLGKFGSLPIANHPFDLIATDQVDSAVTISQFDASNKPIFNFAVARVRYTSPEVPVASPNVKVFFRLFEYTSTDTNFDPAVGYRSYPDNMPPENPLLGIQNGKVISIPCFSEGRVSTSAKLHTQPDELNNKTLETTTPGKEVHAYFGCWLDINQPQKRFPLSPTNADGPFNADPSKNKSIQEHLKGKHVCLIAQIAYDPYQIPDGSSPSTSDKLAQRNLDIVPSDNPGPVEAHRIQHTFAIRPTTTRLGSGAKPDELMIDWGHVPHGSIAAIYWPTVSSAQVMAMAAAMYTTHRLTRVDEHTLQCSAGPRTITYIPIPPGSGDNFAGLISVSLPTTVRKGQLFRVLVRQVTDVQLFALSTGHEPTGHPGRHIFGSFQISIPVITKEEILEPEERLLSVLRWIMKSIPPADQWYRVFVRYIGQIADRVNALGGDASLVVATPTGVWRDPNFTGEKDHDQPGDSESRGQTGKISGLIYDRFGDFEGFILETLQGTERLYRSTETKIEELVNRARVERILLTVFDNEDQPQRPTSIILRRGPDWS